MTKLKKIMAVLLCTSLITVGFSGCGKKEEKSASNSGGASDLYIYNSKGESAKEFEKIAQAYEKETGVKVKVFSIGSGNDHMATLRSEMNTKQQPDIFTVQSVSELREWTDSEKAMDFATAEGLTEEFKALADGVNKKLRLTTNGKDNYGIPYCIEGYGYIVDKKMLIDIFNLEFVDTLLEDLRECDYKEWEQFVKALGAYISDGKATSVKINGNTYKMAKKKTALTKKLTGVFAIAADQSGKWTYSDHMINVAMNEVFETAADAKAAKPDDVKRLRGPFITYAKALNLKTSYMAGANGPVKRGEDMISSSNNYDAAIQNMAKSRAVFLKNGIWAYNSIAAENPEVADRLTFLPIKMPFVQSEIRVKGYTVGGMNSTIPVFVPMYYAINNDADEAHKKAAQDFLVWLNTSEEGKKFIVETLAFVPYNVDAATVTGKTSLANSLIEYVRRGNTLTDPYHGAPNNWSSNMVGTKIYESYLTKETWTQQDYEDIADYAIRKWIEAIED